ncbi:hypothetical protein Cni_G19181 [Canna indica]|uniref:Uncharacterized protein n=1 Tax=Canna indica TaxID=4628 RepID=A0AAQ3QIA7_9LILI|nr:hypothetical protein Cni_G19181 [Canna indica]
MPAFYEEQPSAGDSEADYDSCVDEYYNSDSSKHNSPMGKEKRISVDPLSLKPIATKPAAPSFQDPMHFPTMPPPLSRSNFLSCSLPGSALPSPKSGTIKTSRKWSNLAQPHPAVTNLARQHSAALSRFALEQRMSLRRSKSCGEGRSSAPSDDFIDILSRRPSVESAGRADGAFAVYEPSEEDSSFKDPGEVRPPRGDGSVRCGCLFLPGLSHKKKQVTLRASQVVLKAEKELKIQAYDVEDDEEEDIDKCRLSSVSRAVSLEKFDCGSWTSSSPVAGGSEDDGGAQSYFELPLELIRSGNNETDSPVKAAFVFDKDVKGVLKKSSARLSASKSSHGSSTSNRHVRFSTSAPISYPASPSSTCITPRLRKAREEFNAFLEAQSA